MKKKEAYHYGLHNRELKDVNTLHTTTTGCHISNLQPLSQVFLVMYIYGTTPGYDNTLFQVMCFMSNMTDQLTIKILHHSLMEKPISMNFKIT